MKNCADSVFADSPQDEAGDLIERFLVENDFSVNTRRAFRQDLKKFATWFMWANKEPLRVSRVTTADVSGFRDHLRREQAQAVSTVNRALVSVQASSPGWSSKVWPRRTLPARSRSFVVRHLHRRVWIVHRCAAFFERSNFVAICRAGAIFSLFLFTGCRVGDLVDWNSAIWCLVNGAGSVCSVTARGRSSVRFRSLFRPGVRCSHTWRAARPCRAGRCSSASEGR